MNTRIRTGYSFRTAAGKIEEVMDRLVAIGAPCAPISDTASTFGFVKWRKLAEKKGLQPVYGVELAVTASVNEKKPIVDYWSFFAKDSLIPLHDLLEKATQQFRYTPLLTYEQAMAAEGVTILTGHRPLLDKMAPRPDLFFSLAPSTMPGMVKRAVEAGYQFISASDNRYPNEGDMALYEVICGRNASTQSYPQHILSPDEWRAAVRRAPEAVIAAAAANGAAFPGWHRATIQKGSLVVPEKPMSLEAMCRAGAEKLGVDLTDPVYAARLERELELIALKKFEDYFYIVGDLVRWARQRMVVGPARGSSCGSLVCYLLEITTIDPIPFDLLFERFIDINRGGWFYKSDWVKKLKEACDEVSC